MTENELKECVALQKELAGRIEKLSEKIKSDSFKEMDGLNKDLCITEFNATQALMGILMIRTGLNIRNIQQQIKENAQQENNQESAGEELEAKATEAPIKEDKEVSGQE